MMQPALLGGLFIGILSALPIINVGNCCCLWVIGGGALAAYLEQQDPRLRPYTVARGAKAGLLAGIIGAFVWVVVALMVDAAVAPIQERLIQDMMANSADLPPEVRGWFDLLGTRAAAPFRYAAGFMFQLFAGGLFSTLGGVLTATFLKRDGVPPALGGDPAPPPPPPPPLPPQ